MVTRHSSELGIVSQRMNGSLLCKPAMFEAGGISVKQNCSRLVVDPERFVNDKEEEMSKVGMGVIYVKTSDGRDLRNNPDQTERERLQY